MVTKRVIPAVVILLVFALGIGGCYALLSNLDVIVHRVTDILPLDTDAADTVHGIADQLSTTALTFGWILPAAVTLGLALLRFALPPANGGLTALYVLLSILLWLVCVAAALMLSRLGGIRVWDIITSITDMIRGGILEAL